MTNKLLYLGVFLIIITILAVFMKQYFDFYDDYYLIAKQDIVNWQNDIDEENFYFSNLTSFFQGKVNQNDFVEIYSRKNRILLRIYGSGKVKFSGKCFQVEDRIIINFFNKIDSIDMKTLIPEQIRLNYFIKKHLKNNSLDTEVLVHDPTRRGSHVRITLFDESSMLSSDFLIPSSSHASLGDSNEVCNKFKALNNFEKIIHDFLQIVDESSDGI